MKYIATLALAAALTGPAMAGSPTEPVQINSQREYLAHQMRCAGLLFNDAEHARLCGTMEGNNVKLPVTDGSAPRPPVIIIDLPNVY